MEHKQTFGEYRVDRSFDPSGDPAVHRLQDLAADFIDECQRRWDAFAEAQPESPDQADIDLFMERSRLFGIAQEQAEQAAMWAVKAATKRERT